MNAAELRERANFIGSSDVPAILGFSRCRTPKDVWLEKTKRLEPKPSTNEPAEFGRMVEPVLVEWASVKLGRNALTNVLAHHPEHAFMRAQLDGVTDRPLAVIEAKAYGLFNPRWDGREWGLEGTDHIPRDVMAQVNFAMACSGAESGHVVALLGGGMGVRVYHLERNERLVRAIEDACLRFWNENVKADVPPDAPAGLEALKHVIREPGSFTEIDHDWPDKWLSLKDQQALIEGAVEDAKRAILEEMGEHEEGVTPFGRFSYRANVKGSRVFRYHGPALVEDER